VLDFFPTCVTHRVQYNSPPPGRKRGADGEELDSSTLAEGDSFIDNSFIRTIHSSNKKYAEGRKALQEQVKPAIKGRGIKHKLYSSDEEENPGLQGKALR
jgi:hypothetical protein